MFLPFAATIVHLLNTVVLYIDNTVVKHSVEQFCIFIWQAKSNCSFSCDINDVLFYVRYVCINILI